MASSGKIEELQKKFDENPRRYFAPLANEYRKLGDLEQAIAICREHLPRQPGHMSGHIVYGQALFDAGQLEEAKTVFETALTLDPENLIALRHLGDIALKGGDPQAAGGWYQRVLDADPRNEEIAALLATTASAAAGAPPAAAPRELVQEMQGVLPQAVEAAADGAQEPAEPELEGPPPPSDDAASSVWGAPADETPTLIMETYAPPQQASPAPAPVSDALELEDDLSFDVPSGSQPRASGGGPRSAFGVELDRVEGAVLSVPPAPPPSLTTPPAFPEFSEPTAGEQPPADPFATETMADLYMSQGHYEDALRVYRDLAAQRPGDELLAEKIARVQALMSATPVVAMAPVPEAAEESAASPGGADEAGVEPGPPESPQTVPDLDASEFAPPEASPSRGPTIRQFLGALATRTPFAGNIVQAPPAASTVIEAEFTEVAEAAVYEELPAQAEVDEMPVELLPEEDANETRDAVDPRLAAADSTPASPSGSIDALFGGAGVPSADLSAASALASAFANDDERDLSVPSPIAGSPARRASHELSLDTVFREDTAPQPTPAASFSFDQFFAAPTPAAGTPITHPTPGVSGPASDDDIEQFNSWLQGLKKR